tara:strand:- start:5677 stop:6219 length:543 start_codon:yes stop_codon:yes gene_type:complete
MNIANPGNPDAPIPGANYTTDTRNYPWHRPPDITNMDEAIDHVFKDLSQTDRGLKYLNMIGAGVPISTITDIIVTVGISRGKWTPDFAVLLAGPVARSVEIMAKSYELDYDMGIDDEPKYVTTAEYKSRMGKTPTVEDTPPTATPTQVEDEGGFMSPSSASDAEQDAMLGYETNEEEVLV